MATKLKCDKCGTETANGRRCIVCSINFGSNGFDLLRQAGITVELDETGFEVTFGTQRGGEGEDVVRLWVNENGVLESEVVN